MPPSPELLDELLSLFNDIQGRLQRGGLLLLKLLYQTLNRVYRIAAHVIQQLFLQFLHP